MGFLIAVVSAINMLLYGSANRWYGPVSGVLVSVPVWWTYVFMVSAWDLIPVQLMFTGVHIYNLIKVWYDEKVARISVPQ